LLVLRLEELLRVVARRPDERDRGDEAEARGDLRTRLLPPAREGRGTAVDLLAVEPAAEVRRELLRRAVAVAPVALDGGHDDPRERAVDVARDRPDVRRVDRRGAPYDLERVDLGVRRAARERRVEAGAERPHVAHVVVVHDLARDVLGGEVGRAAEDLARL